MCKKTFIALILLSVAAVATCSTARAEERTVYDEIATSDGTSTIILTVKDCPLADNYGYTRYAYVTRKEGIVAEGCWMDYDQRMFDIWIPEMKSHFQMHKEEFKPHGKPRPLLPEEM